MSFVIFSLFLWQITTFRVVFCLWTNVLCAIFQFYNANLSKFCAIDWLFIVEKLLPWPLHDSISNLMEIGFITFQNWQKTHEISPTSFYDIISCFEIVCSDAFFSFGQLCNKFFEDYFRYFCHLCFLYEKFWQKIRKKFVIFLLLF